MFGGYEDAEVFEDALYQGTSRSSSESDVDSEAEFNLYGLMHYAQDLGIYEKPEDSDKTEGSEQVKKQGHTSNDFTCSINSSQSSKKSPFMFHKPDIICLDSEDSSAIVIDSDTIVHAAKKKKPRREKRVAGDKGKCLKAGKRVQQSDVALELQSSDEDSSSVHSWMLLDDEYESDNKDIWLNVVSGGEFGISLLLLFLTSDVH
uniref:Uncharacterized protein n=1 Tax=Eptatretus burgeri TaxID=7764 RepID=A0A8C4Q0T6_EPTBU